MTTLELLASAQMLRALILVSVDGGPAIDRDARELADSHVRLHAAIEVKNGSKCAWITDAPKIDGRCTRIASPAAVVHWLKVEADHPYFDNVPGGKFRAAPIGWIESPWIDGPWSVDADVKPIVRRGIPFKGERGGTPGTMRYRAIIELGGHSFATPGLSESAGGPTTSGDIRKVMLRTGDDYLGVMTELANLPYIFGSTELGREKHQAERAIGADCADLMVYGFRALGRDLSYRSSRTLSPVSSHVATMRAIDANGLYLDEAGRPITVGPGSVQPGDWIVFSGHVGAFFADGGIDGKLDRQDLLMHIAWKELAIEPMIDSGYGEAVFEVRRPDALTAK